MSCRAAAASVERSPLLGVQDHTSFGSQFGERTRTGRVRGELEHAAWNVDCTIDSPCGVELVRFPNIDEQEISTAGQLVGDLLGGEALDAPVCGVDDVAGRRIARQPSPGICRLWYRRRSSARGTIRLSARVEHRHAVRPLGRVAASRRSPRAGAGRVEELEAAAPRACGPRRRRGSDRRRSGGRPAAAHPPGPLAAANAPPTPSEARPRPRRITTDGRDGGGRWSRAGTRHRRLLGSAPLVRRGLR